jgi:predicted TIM-barrel fold metal-dependent hydrolase
MAESKQRAEALRQRNEAAARRIQALGPHRVVFGSDWIIARIEQRYTRLVRAYPLPAALRDTVFANEMPYLS